MGLRDQVRRLKLDLEGSLETFELLDGSLYHYDALEVHKELFLHALDLQLGRVGEPPELYRMICAARDPEGVLKALEPENPEQAFVNPSEIYDREILIKERRLVPIVGREPEDLSEQ
jgi:hypothetical protein